MSNLSSDFFLNEKKYNCNVSFVTVENLHGCSSEPDALLRQLVPLILYMFVECYFSSDIYRRILKTCKFSNQDLFFTKIK